MFGFGKKRREKAALDSVMEKISLALTDDDFQLRILGPKNYSMFKNMSAIDCHHKAEGEFGRTLSNPIPTNGPIGTLVYLSGLKTRAGERIVFHRLNAIGKSDVYEYVSLSGSEWGFLFVDMYHSRKTTLEPDGFVRVSEPMQLTGFNHFWDDFPYGFFEQKQPLPKDIRMLYASIDAISKGMEGRTFQPTDLHLATRGALANYQ